jgi:KRAB domain-containing zinc finger protein
MPAFRTSKTSAYKTVASKAPAPKTRTMSALRVYCETCGQKSRQSLGQHTETHTVNGRMKCPIDNCSTDFTNESNMKKNVRNIHGPNPWRCKQCNQKFKEFGQLSEHMQARHPHVVCAECCRIFNTAAQLAQHITADHAGRDTCQFCFNDFLSQSFKAYLAAVHGDGDLPFSCSFCDHSCTRKPGSEAILPRSLQKHVHSHHLDSFDGVSFSFHALSRVLADVPQALLHY